MKPVRLRSPMWSTELLKPVSNNLDQRVTVTKFVLEDREGATVMEFEITVKRIGDMPVPRNTKPGAALG